MSITVIVDSLADLRAFAEAVAGTTDIEAKLDQLIGLVSQTESEVGASKMLIDDLENKATAVADADAKIQALLTTIHDELVAANVNNPRVQAVIDMLGQEADRTLAAVAANPDPNDATPPPPPPPGP